MDVLQENLCYLKKCTLCDQEKDIRIDFSPKSSRCILCIRKKNKESRLKRYGFVDPKIQWGKFF